MVRLPKCQGHHQGRALRAAGCCSTIALTPAQTHRTSCACVVRESTSEPAPTALGADGGRVSGPSPRATAPPPIRLLCRKCGDDWLTSLAWRFVPRKAQLMTPRCLGSAAGAQSNLNVVALVGVERPGLPKGFHRGGTPGHRLGHGFFLYRVCW